MNPPLAPAPFTEYGLGVHRLAIQLDLLSRPRMGMILHMGSSQ